MEKHLSENNYLVVKQFIDPQRARDLADSFKKHADASDLPGDRQAPFSASCYNYIDFLELLTEKTKEVSEFVGETVLPTYSYARVYRQGDDLKIHKDRGSCEISLTVNLQGGSDWPIWIKRPDGESVSVCLEPGDAMIYLGCEAEHWRDPIPCDEYVQVFLHYVRSRGVNFSNYFDRQNFQPLIDQVGQQTQEDLFAASAPRSEFKYTEIDCSNMPRDVRDYIKVFENIVPAELCDMILKEYSETDKSWRPAQVGGGVVNSNVRNVENIKIDDPSVIYHNFKQRQQIVGEMTEVMFWIMHRFKQISPAINFESNSGYDLLKYTEGCFYKQHIDSFMAAPRHLAVSLHLNDDYEGGEFAFYNRDLKIKAPKGSAVVFPSNFMYPHEIMPVTKGTRYSIITWII
jgi:Rps23 Pro-64 3,4-dihydroxylase Tpa1-like proline 4-hydroxylase